MTELDQLKADLTAALSKVGLPTLLSKARAAQELDIGLTLLTELIKSGEISTVKVGKRSKIPSSEVLRLATSWVKPSTRTARQPVRPASEADTLRAALRRKH